MDDPKDNILVLWLILAIVFLLLPGCSTIEPDDGRHFSPPTFHIEPYQPPKPPDNSTISYAVFISN